MAAEFTFLEYPDPLVWWHLVLFLLAISWGAFVIGVFAVGGGAIFMPAMLLLPKMTPKIGLGTMYLATCPMAIVRFQQLYFNGRINLRKALPLMAGALLGAILAQFAVQYLPNQVVSCVIAFFAILAGYQTHKKVWADKAAEKKKLAANQNVVDVCMHPVVHVNDCPVSPPSAPVPQISDPEAPAGAPSGVPKAAADGEGRDGKGEAATVGATIGWKKLVAGQFCVGVLAAFFSSASGTGGPLILFPVWLLYDPDVDMKVIVSYAMPFALSLTTCSTVGAIAFSEVIDVGLALIMTTVMIAGILAGGQLMEKLADSSLKLSVGVVLILIGIVVATRAIVIIVA